MCTGENILKSVRMKKRMERKKKGGGIMRKFQFAKQITSSCYLTYLRTELNRWRKSASMGFDKIQRGEKSLSN